MSDYLHEVTHRTADLNVASDALRRAASAWCLAERDAKHIAFQRLSDAACAFYEARKAFRDWYQQTPLNDKNTTPPQGGHLSITTRHPRCQSYPLHQVANGSRPPKGGLFISARQAPCQSLA